MHNGSFSSFLTEIFAVVVLWVGHLIVYQTQAGSIPVHGAK